MNATITWIKVEDRLPDSEVEVIICTESEEITTGNYFKNGNAWRVHGEYRADVRYWADFPLPPGKLKPQQPLDYRMLWWVD